MGSGQGEFQGGDKDVMVRVTNCLSQEEIFYERRFLINIQNSDSIGDLC